MMVGVEGRGGVQALVRLAHRGPAVGAGSSRHDGSLTFVADRRAAAARAPLPSTIELVGPDGGMLLTISTVTDYLPTSAWQGGGDLLISRAFRGILDLTVFRSLWHGNLVGELGLKGPSRLAQGNALGALGVSGECQ
jgi:hypothetical protein